MSTFEDAKKRILERVNLPELIGSFITLQKRSGKNVGLCPFHNEKSPSFYIYDDHYHCFGCKAHGDAIDFVQKNQGLGFIDSLKWLATRYGIEAPELTAPRGDPKARQKRERAAKIMALAQEFFVSCYENDQSSHASQYIKGRNYTDENIKDYGFGLAPARQDSLYRHLSKQGFRFDEIKDCSLVSGHPGRPYDFFQARLMLPIYDTQGRLLAFGGRSLDGKMPKYKHSSYDKKRILFGFHRARKEMGKASRAIVVEGYMDCLQLWNHGLTETVACQGTALTKEHIQLLKNATGMVYLLFDGDQAGRNANFKLIEDALNAPDVIFKVCSLPEGEDPDSYIQAHEREGLEKILSQSEPLLSFVIKNKLKAAQGLSIPKAVSQEIIPWLSRLTNQIQRDFIIHQIADLTGLSTSSIQENLAAPLPQRRSVHEPPPSTEAPAENRPAIRPVTGVFAEFLGNLFYALPESVDFEKVREFATGRLASESVWHELSLEFLTCLEKGDSPHNREDLSWNLSDISEVYSFLGELRNKESLYRFKPETRRENLGRLMKSQKKLRIKHAIKQMKAKLTLATAGKTDDSWQHYMKAIAQLTEELKAIDQTDN